MKWKETIFDNVLRLNRGFDLPNQAIEEGPYPVVASTSIKAYHKTFKVKGPGVTTGRSGSLGTVQYLAGQFWPLNTSLYVKNFKGNNERFIAYFLQTMHLENFNSGAGVPTLNQNHLHKLTVRIPEVPSQRKIAAILTAYDDLIETNKRRVALLEKMAEELYREWFVRMRFPGHQNTKIVKGVPEGWPLERFINLVEMNPRESVHKSDPTPYVGMENLSQTSMHFVSNETRTEASGSKFRNRDTLLPRITPCLENGKRGFVTCLEDQQIGLGSTEFIVFREKVLPAEYIYLLTCNASFRKHAELSMTGASGRQRVQHDCFGYFFIPTPPENTRNQFVEITRPLFDSISRFAAQITVLTKTRNLLLPRLISGKLSVEDLDIQFPSSMENQK